MSKKKNIRVIPDKIRKKLRLIKNKTIIVGHSIQITKSDIKQNQWINIGLSCQENEVKYSGTFIPQDSAGKFSDINVHGEVIIRKDLPKETAYNYVDTPNYGDSYYGYHEVALPYKRYPRDFIPPYFYEIAASYDNALEDIGIYIFSFRIIEPLTIDSKDFDKRLFHCLNLMQENIGGFDIFSNQDEMHTTASSIALDWEILPPGKIGHRLRQIALHKNLSQYDLDTIENRLSFFESLNPKNIIIGTSGLQRYLGAMIRDNLVVFENIKYGNAIYIMYENWKELSTKSRTELLSGRFGINFDRVIHKDGWEKSVRKIIAHHSK